MSRCGWLQDNQSGNVAAWAKGMDRLLYQRYQANGNCWGCAFRIPPTAGKSASLPEPDEV